MANPQEFEEIEVAYFEFPTQTMAAGLFTTIIPDFEMSIPSGDIYVEYGGELSGSAGNDAIVQLTIFGDGGGVTTPIKRIAGFTTAWRESFTARTNVNLRSGALLPAALTVWNVQGADAVTFGSATAPLFLRIVVMVPKETLG